MNMEDFDQIYFRKKLLERRQRLEKVMTGHQDATDFISLMQEVDSALERLDKGTYGMCEVCHDPIENDRLIADPLTQLCLDHLTTEQQHALEQDLYLASRIQGALLPRRDVKLDHWEFHYSYLPAGPVSGDYCDLVELNSTSKDFLFILGDVSGKGVAASLLMTHLHAMFHSLVALDPPVNELLERANRLFCESTLSTHYTTLVCGRATQQGQVDIGNAGHWPGLVIQGNRIVKIDPTGIALGFFCNSRYSTRPVQLSPGDILLFYTDGLTEAMYEREEYGEERLIRLISSLNSASPKDLINSCLTDLKKFMNGYAQKDDLTMMALRWLG
jgi:sigma-B regulation protein RsbU (phosphoserine phosphatase)